MSDKEKRDRKPTGGTGRRKPGKFSGNPDDKRSSYSGAEGERNPFQRRKRISTGESTRNHTSLDRPKRPFDKREDKPGFSNKSEGSGGSRTDRTYAPSTYHKTEGTGEGRPPYRSRSTEDKPSFRTERPARKFEDRSGERPGRTNSPDSGGRGAHKPDDKPSFRTERPARTFDDRRSENTSRTNSPDSGGRGARKPDDKPAFRTERPARKFEDRRSENTNRTDSPDSGSRGPRKPEDRPYRSRSTDDKPSFRTERPARKFEDRSGERPGRTNSPDSGGRGAHKPEDKSSFRTDRPVRTFDDRSGERPGRTNSPDSGGRGAYKPDDKSSFRTERPARKPEDRPYKSRGADDRPKLKDDSPFKKFEIKKKPEKKGGGRRTSFGQTQGSDDRRSENPGRRSTPDSGSRGPRKPDDKPSFRTERPARKFEGKPESGDRTERPRSFENRKGPGSGRSNTDRFSNRKLPASKVDGTGIIRLNKFLADSGVCSRREADVLISAGTVTVNGVVVTEMGMKVSVNDKVNYGGQALNRETLRYVLLNKPKDYITTSEDPYERKTVMELVTNACTERIYPVGRLDRNTTGLLLFTNDGDLAKKLMAPRYNVSKLYHVELNKPLTKADLLRIADGIELEDGIAEIDEIAWVTDAESKKEVGIKIHSGKNRIVRRIFEAAGYEVVKLDRVIFAGLTKLNLTRGKYRHLTPNEIALLKAIK